jgi:leucyl aminopeptidase
MTDLAKIMFAKPARKTAGTLVVMAGTDVQLGPAARALGLDDVIRRATAAAEFTGKARTTLEILAPAKGVDRIVVVGTGKPAEVKAEDWALLGGAAMGALGKAKRATVVFERPDGQPVDPWAAAEFALGAKLRAYAFDKYKGNGGAKGDGASENGGRREPVEVTIAVDDLPAVRSAWATREAVAEGVLIARDLVNEPANVLGPLEIAAHVKDMVGKGVKVEILDEGDMRKLGMRALLGVAQGSSRPPRLAVMRWNGGKPKDTPVAFVGKGVVFDSGGISIKPAANMEDMKGDMAGAAAVVGLMHALAGRKAKVNAVGVVGLVENMPSGTAQRPGDIVEAKTGRTIEIINTDAEGRLVLADAIAYTEERFKPKILVDLATLTGAIIIALGHHHAGLFASDDALANALLSAGSATGEALWRMPLGKEYDKAMDSKVADVKNAGGRDAGAITAAHFIKRFVKDTPWAHLDIAGTAMASPPTEINRSWASGWGVRLLDRLIADNYEQR